MARHIIVAMVVVVALLGAAVAAQAEGCGMGGGDKAGCGMGQGGCGMGQQQGGGGGAHHGAGAATARTVTKYGYVCPMHAQVIKSAPGKCPLCHMALEKRAFTRTITVTKAHRRCTQAATAKHSVHAAATYVCPMCPGVKQTTPGKCPHCHMDLVKK